MENAKTRSKQISDYHKLRVRMAKASVEYEAETAAMPDWAKVVAIGHRIPVSAKVENENLDVESWTSKGGAEMHRVRWADGTATQYEGSLAKKYVAWNR